MVLVTLAKITQIVVALLLVGLVMIQSKSGGLSSALGGSISAYRSKRGLEKTIFYMTIIAGIVLVLNSLVIIYLI